MYAHSGGQYEWDSAAPVGVATAAGCHSLAPRRLAARYNQPDPYLPDLLVCRPELADQVLAAIAAHCSKRRGHAPSGFEQKAVAAARYTSRLHTGCGAAWLARSVRDAEAPGSNPGTPTTNVLVSAPVRPGRCNVSTTR